MNRDFEIYKAPEDEIPVEDKARLEGALRAIQDEGLAKKLKRLQEDQFMKGLSQDA